MTVNLVHLGVEYKHIYLFHRCKKNVQEKIKNVKNVKKT